MRLLLTLLTTLSLGATPWYYDNSALSGSNVGTSWANAWTNYASISWASISPGDTLYISGGTSSQVYTEAFNVGKNGTLGNTITISVGQDAGHNGAAIFDARDSETNLFSPTTGMFVNGGNYTHVTGLVGTNRNLWVINTRVSTADREKGVAMFAGIPHDQLYEGITFSNVNNGISHNGSSCSNIVVRYITGRYIQGDYAFRFSGFSSGSFTNGVYHDCDLVLNADFVGTDGGPDGLAGGGGATFHDNTVTGTNGPVALGQHPDGVQMLGNYNKVYNNHFHNLLNSGVKFEPSTPSVTYWTDNYAYNNIVDVNDATYAASITFNGKGFELGSGSTMSSVTNIVIANNTVVDLLGLAVNGGNGTWPTVPGQFIMENNIGYNCGKTGGALYGWAIGNSNLVFDFNGSVAGVSGSSIIKIDLPGTGVFTTYTQTNTPAAVTFTSYTPYSPSNNYLPTAQVSGVNLSTYFTTDITGATRTIPWTIGAYQLSTTNTPVGSIPIVVTGHTALKGAVHLRVAN